jgi:hypothetical protein
MEKKKNKQIKEVKIKEKLALATSWIYCSGSNLEQ